VTASACYKLAESDRARRPAAHVRRNWKLVMNDRKTCFVVGLIGEEDSDDRAHSDWVFEGIIRPVFKEFGDFREPIRPHKMADPGMINSQVIEMLLDADLVIADLSFSNANAFYEIGIRHMAQKPIIHMQRKGEKPLFDVAGYRYIPFSYKLPADVTAAQAELAAQVRSAMSPEHRVENPVTHARGAIRLHQDATPELKVLFDEIRSVSERIAGMTLYPAQVSLPVPKKRKLATIHASHDCRSKADVAELQFDISHIVVAHGFAGSWGFRESNEAGVIEVRIMGSYSAESLELLRDELKKLKFVRAIRIFSE
jgi:hypothetical protein